MVRVPASGEVRQGSEEPPSGNTGVQTGGGSEGGVSVSLDWLSLTFGMGWRLDDVLETFAPADEWEHEERGAYGYRRRAVWGHVTCLYDGSPEQGYHVVVTGQGCRQMEALGGVRDWHQWLDDRVLDGVRFTRLDLAIDDREVGRPVELLEEAMDAGLVVTRWRSGRRVQSWDCAGREGRTVYFGSSNSAAMLRVYDKAAEQGVEGPWVRWELQLRDERAGLMARMLAEEGLEAGFGVLRGYLEVKAAATGDERSRWPVAPWFLELVQAASKLRLAAVERVVEGVTKVAEWVLRTVSASFWVVCEAWGLDPEQFGRTLAVHGERQARQRHKIMLATHLACCG